MNTEMTVGEMIRDGLVKYQVTWDYNSRIPAATLHSLGLLSESIWIECGSIHALEVHFLVYPPFEETIVSVIKESNGTIL